MTMRIQEVCVGQGRSVRGRGGTAEGRQAHNDELLLRLAEHQDVAKTLPLAGTARLLAQLDEVAALDRREADLANEARDAVRLRRTVREGRAGTDELRREDSVSFARGRPKEPSAPASCT